jgi:hypothetical protein
MSTRSASSASVLAQNTTPSVAGSRQTASATPSYPSQTLKLLLKRTGDANLMEAAFLTGGPQASSSQFLGQGITNPFCNLLESLGASDQPTDCIVLALGIDSTHYTECDLDPQADANWTNRVSLGFLVYDCSRAEGSDVVTINVYCDIPTVPANEAIASLTNIQCSTSINTDGTIGTGLGCSFSYNDISNYCATPCVLSADQASSDEDPVTGLPDLSLLTDSSVSGNSCTVPVQTTCTGTLDWGSDWLLGSNQGLLYGGKAALVYPDTIGLTTPNGSIVQNLQSFFVIITLALLAIPFCFAGFEIMRGLGSENHSKAIELIGKVLLVAMAIGISWTLVTWLIQLQDAFEQSTSTLIQANYTPIAIPSSNWECYTKQFFQTLYNMNIDTAYNTANSSSAVETGVAAAYTQNMTEATLTLIENLPNYVLTLLSILLAVQLVLRLALVNLYIIISPLAIFCGAMPGKIGSNVTSAWLRGFASLLAVQILQMIMLIFIGQALLNPSYSLLGFVSNPPTDWAGLLFKDMIPIAVMVMTLNIPRLFNSSATTLLSTVTSSIGGAMSGIALIIRGL